MPRSKLGLQLPVPKLLQKAGCNPVLEMARQVMEKGRTIKCPHCKQQFEDDDDWALDPKTRAGILKDLADRHKSKPKPHEQVVQSERSIQIIHQDFVLEKNSDKDNPAA